MDKSLKNLDMDFDYGSLSKIVSKFLSGGTFQEFNNISKDTMEASYNVAYNLYEGGKHEDAVKVFKFLCFFNHMEKKYFLGLGACYLAQKNYTEGVATFFHLMNLDYTDPRGLFYMAECFLGLDDVESAKPIYKAVVVIASKDDKWNDIKQGAEGLLVNL